MAGWAGSAGLGPRCGQEFGGAVPGSSAWTENHQDFVLALTGQRVDGLKHLVVVTGVPVTVEAGVEARV